MADNRELAAQACGVLTEYTDVHGAIVHADDESLDAVLDALGRRPRPPDPPWPADLPSTAWRPDRNQRDFGVFLPHHALRTASTRGLGDLTALEALGRWAASRGASVLGTLPLLPTFLHRDPGPYEPSPYAPVSRIFWGEHLVDPTATPEWADCPEAQAILAEAEADGTLEALRSGDLVDPAGAWELQWRLLTALAKIFQAGTQEGLGYFVRHGGPAGDRLWTYAWFRAATQVRGPWPTWADASRFDGVGPHGITLSADALPDVDPEIARTWAYAQWCAQVQVRGLGSRLAKIGVDLYLDLPIGTHPDGFDTWYGTGHRPLHVDGVSAGAPPDPYFPSGQEWGFPPVDPHVSADTNHSDLRVSLWTHADVAGRLRVDHILGFYRLFWVPRGLGAARGLYVRYPAQAWWQALVGVSHATRCQMIGENLGMVPRELTAAMALHDVSGMHVGQFAFTGDSHNPMRRPIHGDLASLNTHDTPTFAGWWTADDIDTQVELGWIDADAEAWARGERGAMVDSLRPLADDGPLAGTDAPEAQRVAASLYLQLARSDAGTVLVNLEDLWAEARPHNVPGTWRECPNWLRRSARTLEAIIADPRVGAVLSAMAQERPR